MCIYDLFLHFGVDLVAWLSSSTLGKNYVHYVMFKTMYIISVSLLQKNGETTLHSITYVRYETVQLQ